jgi:stalled ribosome alternative rescue factor ArfA
VKKGRMKEGKGLGLGRDMRGRQSMPRKKGKGEYQKKKKKKIRNRRFVMHADQMLSCQFSLSKMKRISPFPSPEFYAHFEEV